MIVRKKRNAPNYVAMNIARAARAAVSDEAVASRIRNASAPADLTPDEAYKARLKARITLPKVKGYWE